MKTVNVIKIYEGYSLIKTLVDFSKDVATTIANELRDLGYDVNVSESIVEGGTK